MAQHLSPSAQSQTSKQLLSKTGVELTERTGRNPGERAQDSRIRICSFLNSRVPQNARITHAQTYTCIRVACCILQPTPTCPSAVPSQRRSECLVTPAPKLESRFRIRAWQEVFCGQGQPLKSPFFAQVCSPRVVIPECYHIDLFHTCIYVFRFALFDPSQNLLRLSSR